MILLQDTLISEDIIEKNFVCNLEKCKGACCVEGSSGAPLDADEIAIIENLVEQVKPYMHEKGIELLNQHGYYEIDSDGDAVTTCLPTGECVFVNYNALGQLQCAIQQAYYDGVVTFEKPISCHLYPIRASIVGDYTALNYHKWEICKPACSLGNELTIPIYKFLKGPLERKFGTEWYKELEELAKEYLQS